MAFGQQAGPPASSQQIRDLLSLLQNAGHTDFRDARGPMGFTQRQAGGKFTRDEASALIERLRDEQEREGGAAEGTSVAEEPTGMPSERRLSAAEQALRRMPEDVLAAELRRRGWTTEPPSGTGPPRAS